MRMKMDTQKLLEENRAELNGMDFQDVDKETSYGGAISCMILERINSMTDGPIPKDLPRINYSTARKVEDPFPDASTLDPVDQDQSKDIYLAIIKL